MTDRIQTDMFGNLVGIWRRYQDAFELLFRQDPDMVFVLGTSERPSEDEIHTPVTLTIPNKVMLVGTLVNRKGLCCWGLWDAKLHSYLPSDEQNSLGFVDEAVFDLEHAMQRHNGMLDELRLISLITGFIAAQALEGRC